MTGKVNVRIHYDQRSGITVILTMTVVVAAFLGYLLLAPGDAAASTSQTTLASGFLRKYYLTPDRHNGASVNTACAAGYHAASLWEILDPSNLKYNTDLGYTTSDSGQGPPTWASSAWVRTGYYSTSGFPIPAGQANCYAWSSASASDWGTYVYLNDQWDSPAEIDVWHATLGLCSNEMRVWCVADVIGFPVYLPLLLRD